MFKLLVGRKDYQSIEGGVTTSLFMMLQPKVAFRLTLAAFSLSVFHLNLK